MDFIYDIAMDAIVDSLKLLPFLFITYLLIEWLEHKTSDKTNEMIERSGKLGPVLGAVIGVFPQCGFSAAASNLFAGKVITVGTLIAIYLSTSDEMLPILISEQVPVVTIIKILATKIVIGIAAGLIIDLIYHKIHRDEHVHVDIHHMCEHEHCDCDEKGVLRSAFHHTCEIFSYLLVISFLLNLIIAWIGEERLGALLLGRPVLGELIAGVIGLIPNCAASVILTQLYLGGMLSAGRMITGLLVGSGVGLLVLFRVNDNRKENLKILVLMYVIGVISGLLIQVMGITF